MSILNRWRFCSCVTRWPVQTNARCWHNMLRATCCDRLYTMLGNVAWCWHMLHDVGTCCMKFEIGQTFRPTSANISFVCTICTAVQHVAMVCTLCPIFSSKWLINFPVFCSLPRTCRTQFGANTSKKSIGIGSTNVNGYTSTCYVGSEKVSTKINTFFSVLC